MSARELGTRREILFHIYYRCPVVGTAISTSLRSLSSANFFFTTHAADINAHLKQYNIAVILESDDSLSIKRINTPLKRKHEGDAIELSNSFSAMPLEGETSSRNENNQSSQPAKIKINKPNQLFSKYF